jgi:hypothetical protein
MTTSHRETVMMAGRLKGMGREAECAVNDSPGVPRLAWSEPSRSRLLPVVDFASVRAPKSNKLHYCATGTVQMIQSTTVANYRIQ